MLRVSQHKVETASFRASPHCDERPPGSDIELVVVHGISLPAGQFGLPYIDQLFLGTLDCTEKPDFAILDGLKVSAHCLIRRDGELIQYVPFDKRAWHAGVSSWHGRERCNDFSIGVELEGTDDIPYTEAQYQVLGQLIDALRAAYPQIAGDAVTGHEHIAPGRKTDPGPGFDWQALAAQCQAQPEPCAAALQASFKTNNNKDNS
ncbi:1,6-anhydro-N-acetylmuramyl-L-alanine amidase AmpD [Aliidiomarina soli]|uniref:1,6-anhydro-N-acetylmuramyl-L-alanine amidase AmpD n=1 Tax=Aliidiomarina soli TaxID=1928574 RepID=A0A432WJU1_9GAMM|nr:1,6-anhydro-N-acetylmuramyl-L-alanine amidase AmpD [Aliidiomarina soli]RUO34076.1 1,6-anhydro-N-acetylmuramyl-L-alanine amidase AmpD [Aliidiomarina soli]